ncbi:MULTISPECIES: glycosyltransferase family A protein [unclassified Flavobacterium]|uniref:glycosyltransferase family A protein n=1 Tax=unclassified Flavobacterium TaxID=196869 RepID=UPI00361CEB76
MRIGYNPNKDKLLDKSDYFHQVIIPVYIPNQVGYFKDSLQILKLCLESLFKTSYSQTYFTVVNNGSCTDVKDYLDDLYHKGKLQEVIHTTGIGKLNAILKGLIGHQFKLITITDADVLFQNEWQKATYEVFDAFPKAGSVATTPNSRMCKYFTSNVIFDSFFSNTIKFTEVVNPQAMDMFAKSIGSPGLFDELHLNKYLTVEKNKKKAVVGSGHFVATYRGDIFDAIKMRYSSFSLGGTSETDLLDKPVVDNGYWRLSTLDNHTLHMGNTLEEWMEIEIGKLNENHEFVPPPVLKSCTSNALSNWFKNGLFSRLIFRKTLWELFLQSKGLTKTESIRY